MSELARDFVEAFVAKACAGDYRIISAKGAWSYGSKYSAGFARRLVERFEEESHHDEEYLIIRDN